MAGNGEKQNVSQTKYARFLHAKDGSIGTNVNNLLGNHSFASVIHTTTHAAVGNKNLSSQLAAIKIQLLTQTKFFFIRFPNRQSYLNNSYSLFL